MQNILFWAAGIIAGFLFLRAVIRTAVKQNDFTVILVLIVGAVAVLVSL